MSTANIQYIGRNTIDIVKWDDCIDSATNGLVYAYAFFLDQMAEQWDALVMGDYEMVMPLPWKKKAGLRYLYWMPFSQQLGIFSRQPVSQELVAQFLDAVHQHFYYGEIFFNHANRHPVLEARVNYVLPLSDAYATLQGKYKGDLLRNLDKAARSDLHYNKDVELHVVLDSFRQTYAHKIKAIQPKEYQRFERLCHVAQQQGNLLLRGVQNEVGQWLSTALLLNKRDRMYLLNSTNSPEGRKTSANHFLLDQIIRDFAGTGKLLDFEGSDIPGIAHFYANFGAVNQPYCVYRFNNLPWWIKWIKP